MDIIIIINHTNNITCMQTIVTNNMSTPNHTVNQPQFLNTYTPPGGAPYDGSADDVIHHNHKAMEVSYSIMASAGLIFAIACLAFNVLFRNRK